MCLQPPWRDSWIALLHLNGLQQGQVPVLSESPRLRDGIYSLSFAYESATDPIESALAIARDGAVLASDPQGGVYRTQSYRSIDDRHIHLVIECVVPPYRELITGHKAGADGLELMAEAIIDVDQDEQTVDACLDGQVVAMHICYLGPLPGAR